KIGAGDHICAYFTAKQSIDTEALKAQLKNILPQYMIPTAYKQLEKMPMTQNGKMNLKALPEPEMAEMGNYTPPSTETEAYFCTLFERILEREKVGINDNFFELGGTSLVVSSIIIEATKAQFEITYGDVFSRPTPKQLAAMFEHETKAEEKNPLDDLADYDYHTLMPVLEQNTLEAFRNEEKVAIGNILLTGATGFLGIHFLREFLKKEEGIAYCLMRKGKFASTKERLISMLVYYFDQDFEDEFDKRIIIREGDVTHYKDFEQLKDEPIDTVFNCAANVKHFSKGTDIEDVNVGGVLNCIRFCEEKNSRLVHISTTSVGGFSIDGALSGKVLTEQALYFGQALDTKYGHSKFEAERAVLEHIKTGLSAKIMRVGNLSARDSDGEFQINFASNSFVGRLKAYKMIGSFPYNMMSSKSELAPIDSTAEAILQLSKTPKSCCIFHPYNNHTVFMGDIITAMQDKGLKVELSEHEDFERALELAGKDPEKAKVLSSMVAYQNMGHGREVTPVPVDNEYTMQVLYRMNYRWPMTSKDYMVRFLEALDGLGFFS
ncbi:MAG: SDR family oxidoreductase, partial [Eubacterium sp.]